MAVPYSDCEKCGTTVHDDDVRDGKCEACYDLSHSEGETVEVPVSVLRRLMSTAESRHPTACTQDAPRFRQVLTRYGYPVEREN